MIVGNGIGYRLEQHSLTCLRLRYDQTSLSLAYRREHIHDAAGNVASVAVAEQIELLVREEGSEEVERYAVPDIFRRTSVDAFYLYEREIFVAFLRRPYLAAHEVAGLEGVYLDLLL